MAVATALAIGTAAYGIYSSEQKKKEAKRNLNDYERQALDNAFENIQISTMGSDLLKEQDGITSASMVDSAQQAGTRGILSTLPKIVGYTNSVNQEAAKMLDDQNQRRSYAIAGDNARIEGITENRDVANIAGYSSQINQAQQDTNSYIMGGLSAASLLEKEINARIEKNKGNEVPESVLTGGLRPSNTAGYNASPYSFNTPYNGAYSIFNQAQVSAPVPSTNYLDIPKF